MRKFFEIKLTVIVGIIIAATYFSYSLWPVQKTKFPSDTATPNASTVQVADPSFMARTSAPRVQECPDRSANPFRKGSTSCSAEEVNGAINPPSVTQQEVNDQKKILTNLTNLSSKFDQFQKNTDPESLSGLIIMADECQIKSMGETVSQSNSCIKLIGQRQAAQEALAQSADSGNPAAQYLYGTLLQVNATSGIRMSPDSAIRAADYKRGEILIRRAADAGDAQAKSTVDFLNSIQKGAAAQAK